MITIINSFPCEPKQQENLVRALRDAAPELGALPGMVAATLHRSLDAS
jgi:Antibiotic biosynthesis monooxygenase